MDGGGARGGSARGAEPPFRGGVVDGASLGPHRGDDAHRPPRAEFRIHRIRIPADEQTVENRIPVTTISRTLFDLAAVVPRAQVENAIKQADMQQLGDRLSLPDLLGRHPRARGATTIRTILDRGATLTRSELEVRFVAFIERSGLPPPEVNRPLHVGDAWIECDCMWRKERVIVELDGYAAHGTFAAFEKDRARPHAPGARMAAGPGHMGPAAR